MKQHNLIKKTLLFIALVTLSTGISHAQNSKNDKNELKRKEISNLIDTKNYIFEARTALPTSGRQVNLTSTYDVRVSGDSIITYLPFFGRAYVAPMNPNEGGIKFTSTSYSYNVKDRKKGGWDITILPKDAKDVRQMFLTVSEDGYATLNIISTNRSAISYNGIVRSKRA
ncbi:MAG TPA: DUF4251 domain-containing protein [Segetibacter sp.]